MRMRPKSIATVVEVLAGTPVASSTPAPASVMTASVVSGTISETLATEVVLPTPKPPATTTLTGRGGRRRRAGGAAGSADGSEPMDHPQDGLGGVGDAGV